jgi:hypothetical protein
MSFMDDYNRFWTFVVKTDACWLWVGAVDEDCTGYKRGKFRFRGKTCNTGKVIWIFTFGDPPKGLEVCHTCDNGLCVRPHHLFLGTHEENMQDCGRKGRQPGNRGLLFGTKHPLHKLTSEEVTEIRRLQEQPQKQLAEIYGVSVATIQDIQSGRTWNQDKHGVVLPKPLGIRRKLNKEDADSIRVSEEAGQVLAKRYGISTTLVSQIKNNQAWV